MAKCASATGIGKPRKNSIEWADKYIEGVINGSILTCELTRLAVERHVNDIKHSKKYYFDRAEADFRLKTFNCLRHSKGRYYGNQFILAPWQQWVIASIFGWKRKKDGKRRFRTVYEEVPRKNGKTTKAAGVAINLLDMDGEMGAEVYSAATKRDQARIVHGEAVRMILASPELRQYIVARRDNLHVVDTGSKFEPLSADYNSLDGLNVHGAIIDELHAHKTRELYDVLDTATGAREQPMIYIITTAGVQMESICRELHEYTENILRGIVEDNTFFGVIYTIDPGDKWDDETSWWKANPNLGVSLSIDDMRAELAKAATSKSSLAAWQRYRLDVWGHAAESWIHYDKWKSCACAIEMDELKGRRCYVALDLSSTTDTSAAVFAFPMDDGTIKAFYRFWLPEVGIADKEKLDRVPYRQWESDGYLTLTPGDVIDYDFIEGEILRWAKEFQIAEVAADPYNATQLLNHLVDAGLNVFEHRQGFVSMNMPSKEFEVAVSNGTFRHEDNPIMRWQINNVELKMGDADNQKPVKKNNRKRMRIDGVIVSVMAVGRIKATVEEGPRDFTVIYI